MTNVTAGGVVEFRFYRPEAKSVSVAGSFNQWSQNDLRMMPAEEGWWTAKVALPAGEYRFRYVADDRWYTDFAAFGIEPTSFGMNSILVVSKALANKRLAPELKAQTPVEQVAEIQRQTILRQQFLS